VNPINILLLIVMTLFGALGGFFFKKSTTSLQKSVKGFVLYVTVGGIFYVVGAVLNILLLKGLPYSIVFPLTSVTYFWTMIISSLWLKEKITKKKVIGVTLVLIGCIFLSIHR
jgi:drug/metabolite transporter (DMT)-like permease